MAKDKENTTQSSISMTSAEDVYPFDVICAYACPPEWPKTSDPGFWSTTPEPPSISTVKKVEVDIEKVQEIITRIRGHKKELKSLDETGFEKDNVMQVSIVGRGIIALIYEGRDTQTDLAEGIIELIRSYHENEIEKLNDELVKLIGG